MLDRYHEVLASLAERSRIISPLWQRGERITRPIAVHALCKYEDGEVRKRVSPILFFCSSFTFSVSVFVSDRHS